MTLAAGDMGPIHKLWTHDDNQRQPMLDTVRLCAALTKPWILPPIDTDENDRLPENFQSLGSRGITTVEGKMLISLFPPGQPWFTLDLSPKIKYDDRIPLERKQELQKMLFLRQLTIMGVLESQKIRPRGNRRSGFRTAKRSAISQLLITGDVLERMDDLYRLTTFRRDHYTTKRNTAGEVLYHTIKEVIDPLSLSDEQRERVNLNAQDFENKSVSERMMPLFTHVRWHPQKKVWVTEQELNGRQIDEPSEEPISRFFSTPYELVAGENYGRGFIEQNLGDLRSLDTLREKLLDFAAMASKLVPVIDDNSSVQEADLTQRSGKPIRARVLQGKTQDIDFLKVDKIQDFTVASSTAERIEKTLGAAMLMESAVQPQGERVTAFQVQRIALELEGALGGLYAPVADDQQIPLVQRTIWQMERDNLIEKLPDDAVDITVQTGLAALSKQIQAEKIAEVVSTLSMFGPEELRRIDVGALANHLVRSKGIDVPGLLKSEEQLEKERQAEIDAQNQMALGAEAAKAAGNVATQQITGG